ncbi:MAG: flagellar basal body rod protein FlgB [Pseudomonadota bacterium]
MSGIGLFGVAFQQAQWLSVRQTAIAENIANANTPGYRAVDVESFDTVLQKTGLDLSLTTSGHMATGVNGIRPPAIERAKDIKVSASGNSVGVERELIKAEEVNRAYALNTNVVKAFHKMLLMSVK